MMAEAGACRRAVVEPLWRGCLMALRCESTALPMLDDGESSNTKLGFHSGRRGGNDEREQPVRPIGA
jgi:hypothetical protein